LKNIDKKSWTQFKWQNSPEHLLLAAKQTLPFQKCSFMHFVVG